MSATLTSKLPSVGTTIFTVMSALAQKHNAINLSQGFPDFPADSLLIDLVYDKMRKGHNQYAPMAGLMNLREELAKLIEEKYGAAYNPETEITVTSGGTEALFCAIMCAVKEGDEVIVIEPAYDSYLPAIQLAGATPVCVPLSFPDYKINWESVKRVVNRNTRAIILNTPHNPTGSVMSAEDWQELEKIISQNDIFVISDEVYEHIIFDGLEHQSAARFPNIRQRAFIISSFGKTFHTTGWKLGYCVAPEALSKEFRKVHQFVTFASPTPFQAAIADYLQNREHIYQLSAFYQQKRDIFLNLMRDTAFEPLPTSGSYFQLMRYDRLSAEKDLDFCVRLTQEVGVAAIPVSVFYRTENDNRVIRFCFAKEQHTLEQAAEKLSRLVPAW